MTHASCRSVTNAVPAPVVASLPRGVIPGRGRRYHTVMEYVFPILVVLAMLATLGVLFLGVFGMGREGLAARVRSNKLMQWRVILQAGALLLFVIFMLLYRR